MKVHQLRREQIVRTSPSQCWEFFSNPHNLRRLTPEWMDFTVTSETPEAMYAGLIISYRIRPLLGLPMTWVTEITHVKEGCYFVDEQRFGPYRMWHHQHLFEPICEEMVKMTDIVDYVMPLGPLGEAVHALHVGSQVRQIFDYRIGAVETLFPERVAGGAGRRSAAPFRTSE